MVRKLAWPNSVFKQGSKGFTLAVFGISDLHLSFGTDKPMDVFGPHWQGHAAKMAANWDAMVGPEDIVLCPGDLSWAMTLDEAQADLSWIGARPGKKILGRGNHDYWWSGIGKVRAALPPNCWALQNDAIDMGEVVIAGSRLWSGPHALDFKAQDQKIYDRELARLELSLKHAQKIADGKTIIASVHYPPFGAKGQPTHFVPLLHEYGVTLCVYGHLHGHHSHRSASQGQIDGINYKLIACDYLNFAPIELM
tara:strand:+ start:3040 stop:3795 length:756 start_codon:yes stop_codon:yes gene_type:complete